MTTAQHQAAVLQTTTASLAKKPTYQPASSPSTSNTGLMATAS